MSPLPMPRVAFEKPWRAPDAIPVRLNDFRQYCNVKGLSSLLLEKALAELVT